MRKMLFCAALLAALFARTGHAQVFTRPWLDWRTVTTEHFEVHYPAEMSAWTLDVVSRLEAVHDSVRGVVGYAPGRRVRIIVEDPSAGANGSAFSFLDEPTISLWPTPPDPRSNIGHNRGPGEQLIIHEFAHIAHLTRPSRNPLEAMRMRLSPVRVGPVARRAPRWVTEGYATYVEGRLTGSGRPHSALRAAVLRQWALEGRLPSYAQLSQSNSFQGPNMAYLVGSAFLEWLVERRGEESLEHLWRRLSARQSRAFPEAFAGVYGGPPHELYGLFTVEVTARALEARGRMAAVGGPLAGDTVQRLTWSTGDPAVSPDGERMAVVLRGGPGTESRVVVWRTREERGDSAEAAARRRLLRRDPQDVPDARWRPRTKAAIAMLLPVAGRGHDAPRFLPDGKRILLVRQEPIGGGASRPDLFLWEWQSKRLTRVTRGAGIRSADPAPDGRSAAAVCCEAGICDLVRVDLATGAVSVIAAGAPARVFYRPRWAPDGRSIAVAVQERGRWRVERIDPATGARTPADPDDGANRYDAAWLPGGREMVVVSERGGVANLEVLDPVTHATRTLTRVTGAAMAPEPNPRTGEVFYLAMHAAGLDVNRVRPDSVGAAQAVVLPAELAPVAPRAPAGLRDTLPRSPVPPSRAYGIGPRITRILPMAGLDEDGASAGFALSNVDPVGRLALMARALAGESDGSHGGGSLAATWRGWRPALTAELFAAGMPVAAGVEVRGERPAYFGATAFAEVPWRGTGASHRLQGGVSGGSLEGYGDRLLGFAEYGVAASRRRAGRVVTANLRLNAAAGSTAETGWARGVGSAGLGFGMGMLNLRADGSYGRVSGGAPAFEAMTAGGSPSPLMDDAALAQRIPMPAAPFGVAGGRELATWRLSTRVRGLTPYLWGAASDGLRYRVAGVEGEISTGFSNVLGFPGARLTAGLGVPLDEPGRHSPQAYLSVTYRP
jgi:hypothetical protein